MWFPAKITSTCIWVAIPVDWVILYWYACGADGRRAVGVRSRDYQIFWDGQICLAMMLRWRALRARESSAITGRWAYNLEGRGGGLVSEGFISGSLRYTIKRNVTVYSHHSVLFDCSIPVYMALLMVGKGGRAERRGGQASSEVAIVGVFSRLRLLICALAKRNYHLYKGYDSSIAILTLTWPK